MDLVSADELQASQRTVLMQRQHAEEARDVAKTHKRMMAEVFQAEQYRQQQERQALETKHANELEALEPKTKRRRRA